ncbi:MAG: hypothetical protein ACQEQG_10800, partial [Bacillota bacterium]
DSTGYLEMTDINDRVNVDGNFVMDSRSHSGKLTTGILEVKGDFTQRSSSTSSYAYRNFQAANSHKVVFSGVDQVISFEDHSSGSSCFAKLDLASTGIVTFATKSAVTEELISSLITVPVDSKNLYPAGSALINGGVWNWNLGLVENWTLQQNITIKGDFHIFSGTYNKNDYTLTVEGTEIVH